jgi:hypothetical protein
MAKTSDPTKDPEFQKVVRHFLTTPPKPHKPIGERKKGVSLPMLPKTSARIAVSSSLACCFRAELPTKKHSNLAELTLKASRRNLPEIACK